MIFIVVKWKPKAEYVENFTDEVAEFTAGHPQRAGQPVLRVVPRCGRPVGICSGGRVP